VKKHRLAKLLSILMIMAFLVSAGAVSCGPTAGPPPAGEQPPGGQLPGEQPPGGPAPGEQPPGGPPPGGPTPGGPPPGDEVAIMFVADPDVIPQGGCTMLRWEVNPPGEWRVLLDGQEVPRAGEREVCPPGTISYELLVETPGGSQTRAVTVNVGGGPPGPQPTQPGPGPQPTQPGPGPAPTPAPGSGCAGAPTFSYFTASSNSITAGQQVQLSWGAVTNGTSGPLVGSVVLSPGGFGEVGSPGSRWASATTTTTYRLTATGCGGTATKDVTVTVGGAAPAATATPHPVGPTATPHPAGPTATKQAPTSTPAIILTAVLIPVPAATATATTGSTTSAVRLTNKCGRLIEGVYIRKKGESSWGSDRLAQSGSIELGSARTFQLAPGNYEMRALCCDGQVVSEHSVTLSSGTYDWTVIAALDIHNDTDGTLVVLYIYPSGVAESDRVEWLSRAPSWPGCDVNPADPTIPPYQVMRCYFSPGYYDMWVYVTPPGATQYTLYKYYHYETADVEGNSAWFVKTQFWTPPAD